MRLQNRFSSLSRMLAVRLLMTCAVLAVCCFAAADQSKSAAKSDLTGRYEGTAKNTAGEVIPVTFELAEKEGAVTGTIHSTHGDFTITRGSHEAENVTLEFDTGGPTGTIALKMTEDKLVGTWSAGDDNGPVEVKRVAAQDGDQKGKS